MHLGIAINTFVSHSTTTILLAGQHITPADIVQRFLKSEESIVFPLHLITQA